jgi:uroporphyrinogen decarboxylase
MGLFTDRTNQPVWFMRQAGRYHKHYQEIRKQHDFMKMCKNPELACEITMGPIRDFNFDAAILFSDLLFPLEFLGMGLNYHDGPPKLGFHLKTVQDLEKLSLQDNAESFFSFQGEATKLLRKALPQDKTLIGFVGAPFTLYTYAVEGSHHGNLVSSKLGLIDGRFKKFTDILLPALITEVFTQLENGADAMAFFDTAVGELSVQDFEHHVLPLLNVVFTTIKEKYPTKKIIYYSKFTHLHYLKLLRGSKLDVLGIDWRMSLPDCLQELSSEFYIQGNVDPAWLFLPWSDLEAKLNHFLSQVPRQHRLRWIGGLGHGVLPMTPEENVKKAVRLIQSFN